MAARPAVSRLEAVVMVVCAVLASVFLLLAAYGCAGTLPTPPTPSEDPAAPARFQHVAGNLYRSAQPTAHQLAYLHDKYGVTEVVKLNGIEAREPQVPGVEVVNIPLSVLATPTGDELDAVVAWIDKGLAHGVVLVHCSHGEDRTGLAIATWEMRHGVPWRDAFADMAAHGWHPYHALWRAFAREAGW